MYIIDRFLLLIFLKVFAVGFLSLTGLYIMVDTANNFEEFFNYGQQEGSFFKVLLDYFGPRVLQFYDRTGPILVLVAAMYTLTWMQRTNELTAIIAGGVSKARVIRPLVLAAISLSLIGFVNREVLIPRVREKLIYNAQNLRGENARPLTPLYDNDTDIFLDGRATVGLEQRIEAPKFGLPPALANFGQRIVATNARYLEPDDRHPGGYLFDGIEKPANFAQLSTGEIDGRPIVLTPKDNDWLEPQQGFVVSNVRFEQLSSGPMWQELSSVHELIRGMREASLDFSTSTRVRVHARLLQPFLDLTLFFLGIPLVFSRETRNIFLSVGQGLLIVCVFFLVTIGSHSLGSFYFVSPALAAWLPLIIFAPCAATLAGRIWE